MISNDGFKRSLTFKDLSFFGISAIVGAGIFGTIGNAVSTGGPGTIFLFIFTAFACGFSAWCYAEFASMVSSGGSAYSYAYHAFGRLVAWIIGWDLIMEYSIGNIAVAISWSDYFTNVWNNLPWLKDNLAIPSYLSTDYLSAKRAVNLNENNELFTTWNTAPQVYGFRLIADIPALLITVFVTYLAYIGIKESKNVNNVLVYIKLCILILIIVVGCFYIDINNWSPFFPNGTSGVFKGVSAVFFAYIGFDAISTASEEAINPNRDLPKAMMASLLICAILYSVLTLVITGLVPYYELALGDPLAFCFDKIGLKFMAFIISISAVLAMTGVLLIFQIGQPRIWYAMSKDGLLPAVFSKIHPNYKTPSFSTICTGFVVAIPALFMNLTELTDLTSIGTLFAFFIVCLGVLYNHKMNKNTLATFKVPFISLQKYHSIFWTVLFIFIFFIIYLFFLHLINYQFLILGFSLSIFLIIAYFFNFSLIPSLGVYFNLILLSEMGITNWIRFGIWLLIGLVIYYFYGRNNK